MGNNHEKWYDQSKRKILIMAFEDKYINSIAKAISKKEITVNNSIGFSDDEIYYNNLSLKLYYLTTINRHLWKHHLQGTQGIIMIF
jgi:ribosome recycling factor